MKLIDKYEILENRHIHTNIYCMIIKTPIGSLSLPGQFVMLYLENGVNLLPRPISIADATQDTITIVYAVVGEGTKSLANMKNTISVMGPIGNGFSVNDNLSVAENIAIIGGGVGVPPMHFLTKRMKNPNHDIYLGFRDQPILQEEFNQITKNLYIATDTGNHGKKGNVIDLLRESGKKYDVIYACGPTPMLKALQEYLSGTNTRLQISLEEHMACGIGTCVGCVVKTKDEIYEKICTKGPVFNGFEVVL